LQQVTFPAAAAAAAARRGARYNGFHSPPKIWFLSFKTSGPKIFITVLFIFLFVFFNREISKLFNLRSDL